MPSHRCSKEYVNKLLQNDYITKKQYDLLIYIAEHKHVTSGVLRKKFGANMKNTVIKLVRKNIIMRIADTKSRGARGYKHWLTFKAPKKVIYRMSKYRWQKHRIKELELRLSVYEDPEDFCSEF